MSLYVWYSGTLDSIKRRVPQDRPIGLYCVKNGKKRDISQLTAASFFQFERAKFNPFSHARILVLFYEKSSGTWYALGTVSWFTLQRSNWSFYLNQLVHDWGTEEMVLPRQVDQVPDTSLFTLMLGTAFHKHQMQQEVPYFRLERALDDCLFLVRHLGWSAQQLESNYGAKRSVPWVALWMVADVMGNAELTTAATAWEKLDFLNRVEKVVGAHGEPGLARLFKYNRVLVDERVSVVSPTYADLQWYYERHGRQDPPTCMFLVPLAETDVYAPYQPSDGGHVRISYRELGPWLWHCQCKVRREWRTQLYAQLSQGSFELPEQIKWLIECTWAELIKLQATRKRKFVTHENNREVVLDVEDFLSRAAPCVRRAIEQTRFFRFDADHMIDNPSEPYWLKNDARNEIIRSAAEMGYPASFIEQILLQVRQRTDPGATLDTLRHLVDVKSQTKYPCMNCEQVRAAKLKGFSCVWSTDRDDVAKFQCHMNFVVEQSNLKSREDHWQDAPHFKKPSFYLDRRKRKHLKVEYTN